MKKKLTRKYYSNPKGAGWKGWIENEAGTAVAFIKLDGEVVWNGTGGYAW